MTQWEAEKTSMSSTLVTIHDPMCSWCWGFSRSYQQLVEALPESIKVTRLLGGLAPDSSEPMPKEMQQYLQNTWKTIETTIPGTRFNHDFWTLCQPRRSTWPACRAVIAARHQGPEYDLAMTIAIQRGYYLEAKNPSDDSTLIGFAEGLGLDTESFSGRLNAESTRQQLEQEIMMVRRLGVQGFPSLVLLTGNSAIPVRVNYTEVEAMLDSIYQAHTLTTTAP